MYPYFWCCTKGCEQLDLCCLILVQIRFRWTRTFSFTDDWDPEDPEQIRKSVISASKTVGVQC